MGFHLIWEEIIFTFIEIKNPLMHIMCLDVFCFSTEMLFVTLEHKISHK